MTKRSSAVTHTLCDLMFSQALRGEPIGSDTTLRIVALLRFIAADCDVMERRLAGEPLDEFDAPNVVTLHSNKPSNRV